MIETKVIVPKEIVAKGLASSRTIKSFLLDLYAASSVYFFAWSVIIFVDVITNNSYLIWWHFLALLILAIIMSVFTYAQEIKDIKSRSKDVEYNLKLDDSGVYINDPEKHYKWGEYQYYIEYDDYLKIKGKKTGISFLPKTAELSEVIEYTKTKIPNKAN